MAEEPCRTEGTGANDWGQEGYAIGLAVAGGCMVWLPDGDPVGFLLYGAAYLACLVAWRVAKHLWWRR